MNRWRLAALAARTVHERIRIALLLRTRPLDQCLDALHPVSAPPPDYTADEVGEITERLLRNRRRPRTTCLQRALARYALLRRLGRHPTFLIGIDPARAEIEGHAWILLEGEPFWETEALDCTPTFRYPPRHDDRKGEQPSNLNPSR